MGEVKILLSLINALDNELINAQLMQPEQARRVDVEAVVDTGARLLALPTPIAGKLGLRNADRALVTLGDGSIHEMPIQGYVLVRVQVGNVVREVVTSCLVGPAESPVSLGQIPLEIMDLIVDCPRQRVTVSDPSTPMPHMTLY